MLGEKVEKVNITEDLSFHDILMLFGGVQKMKRDGGTYIGLVRGLEIIKEAIDNGLIHSGQLKVIMKALYDAAGKDTFYEPQERVGELVRGFNEFINGFRAGERSGMRITSRVFAPTSRRNG